jgi:DNA segregation ATPase FtsK/SpoIIIE, S-DNA-T family
MITDEIGKTLEGKIDDLSNGLSKISERQNSQYTDIMMQLTALKDEIDSRHTRPEENRTDDELYEEARDAVVEIGRASTSFVQRLLGVGYSRAAQLMDKLEVNGVIGPARGSKPREVIKK